jgi:hypothetical protein
MAYFAQINLMRVVSIWPVRLLGVALAIIHLEICCIPPKRRLTRKERYLTLESQKIHVCQGGDHLMTPFQWELCHLKKAMGPNLVTGNYDDVELFEIMRQANLDAFWEQASFTADSNLRAGMQSEKTTGCLNMRP